MNADINSRQQGNSGEKKFEPEVWRRILKAGVEAQRLIQGSICVGGTAAALYAKHRISLDTDHLVPELRYKFDDVRETLEANKEWKTARVQPPVLILGSLGGVEVGFRQLKRSSPVETTTLQTSEGPLVVPTLDELICMKAYLAYVRNATRDYLDFAALSQCASERAVLDSLLALDPRYGELQTASVALEVAKALSACFPFDLEPAELAHYKALDPKWHSWEATQTICRHLGGRLATILITGPE